MIVEYTGRGFTLHPNQKLLADAELARINTVLSGRIVSVHIILTEEKYRHTAEISVQLATETLVARCEGTEMMAQLNGALNKVEQQAIKHKERRMTVERHAKPDSAEPLIEVPDVPPATATA